MAKIVELGLPIAVWFGLDGPQVRGLVHLDGGLPPTGKAFKPFIEPISNGKVAGPAMRRSSAVDRKARAPLTAVPVRATAQRYR